MSRENNENMLEEYERMERNRQRQEKEENRNNAIEYFRNITEKKSVKDLNSKKNNSKIKRRIAGFVGVVTLALGGFSVAKAATDYVQNINPSHRITQMAEETNVENAIQKAMNSIKSYIQAETNNTVHVNYIFKTGEAYMAEFFDYENNKTFKAPVGLQDVHKRANYLIEQLNNDLEQGILHQNYYEELKNLQQSLDIALEERVNKNKEESKENSKEMSYEEEIESLERIEKSSGISMSYLKNKAFEEHQDDEGFDR